MKTIIVPVDFSATSANATEFAANLAAFYGAAIWLYHVYEIPVALNEFSYLAFNVAEMQEAAEHELEILKKSTMEKVRIPVSINCKAEMNLLDDGLAAFCDAIKPDLVVMGLTGKNALTRLVVGSNTIRIIHTLHYPVLVVPHKAEFIPIRKIGFACDYQHVIESTPVSLLKKIVRDFNAELHVVNVDFQNTNFDSDMFNERFILNELLHDIKVEYHNIEAEDVTEGINLFADKAKLDWIVAIPKKHQLLQKMFKRSHTQDLLYHTHVPVLCIHE